MCSLKLTPGGYFHFKIQSQRQESLLKVERMNLNVSLKCGNYSGVLTFEQPLDDVVNVDLPLGHGWCLF